MITKKQFNPHVILTPDIFIPLYSTLVRPHLEYAILASSPYLKKYVDHLEHLQRLATWMVKGCRNLSQEERFEKWNLFSLVRGRLLVIYPTAPWIHPWRNSTLSHPVPAFEEITWNCIKGVSSWTEGRPPSPFGSLGPETRCQPMLSNRHLPISSSQD